MRITKVITAGNIEVYALWRIAFNGVVYDTGAFNTDYFSGSYTETFADGGTFTLNDTYISVYLARSSSNPEGGMTTVLDSPIDATNYSTLKVYISSNFNTYTTKTKFFVGVSNDRTCTSYSELSSYTLVTATKDAYISIDLSNIEGELYIYMGGEYIYPTSGSLQARMYITEIYFE